MVTTAVSSSNSAGNDKRYQVMLVDDSAVVRGLFSRWLEEDDSIEVVAYAANGAQALKELERHELDVVVLDIEMPEMDGMEALPKILQAKPDVKVIMASTLTHRNAEISLRALRAGASEYVPKPTTSKDLHSDLEFRREMIDKIKALAAARRRQKGLAAVPKTTQPRASSRAATVRAGAAAGRGAVARGRTGAPEAGARPAAAAGTSSRLYANQEIQLRPQGKARPEILAVGSSTGGPQALFTVFGFLKGRLHVPVVITQHMPATFTSILAEHLSRVTGGTCKEGEDGEELKPGTVYLAPGDHHMLVEKKGGKAHIRITEDPPENFCRPAVDPMMRSLKKAYNDRILAVILTGMGQDGLKGCRELADAGCTVLAQDEATSVVWGMPGAVATNGVCSAILPIDEIGPTIAKVLGGGRL